MIKIERLKQIQSKVDLQQLLHDDYNDDYNLMILEISRSLNQLYRKSIKDADAYLFVIKNCFKFIPKEYNHKLFSMHARLALWNADYKTSITFYQKALTSTSTHKDYYSTALIQKGMIEVYMYLSKYDDGLKIGKKALTYFKRHDLSNHAGQVMTNIGNIYHRMDKNRLALEYYNKAKKIFAKEGGVACAIVDFNRANIYANMNELGQAKKLYLEAGAFYKKAKMELAFQQTEYSIAYLLYLESKYTDALSLFEKVYDSFEKLGDKTAVAVTQLDLAELNLQLNQYGSVIMLSELILPIFKKYNMPYEEGKANYFAAIAKIELGDITQSKLLLNSAKKIFIKEKNSLWLGMIEYAMTSIFLNQKKYRKALEASVSAKKYYKKSKDIRREHDADIAYIETLFLTRNETKAFKVLSSLLTNKLTNEQQRKIYTLLGEHYFAQKLYDKAQSEFLKAVKIVETMMHALHSDEIKFFFAADKFNIYARIVECSLYIGEIEQSYLYNLKAISLLNEKIIPTEILQENVPKIILTQIDSLRQNLSQAYKFPQKGKRLVLTSQVVLKTEKQLWHLEQKARAYQKNIFPIELQSKEQQKNISLKENETILNYFISGDKIGLFVQDALSVKYVNLPLTLAELTALVRKIQFIFEQSIHKPSSENVSEIKNAYLQEMYNALIAPANISSHVDSLFIIPDAVLNQVPFIALLNNDKVYMYEDYNINIIADPQSLHGDTIEKIDFSKLKNAIFSASHESLPLVEIEGEKIQQHFKNSNLYANQDAKITTLKKACSEVNGFIHIAAHASRSSENPLFSRIMMTDGVLFPFDLYGHGIKAELVTLSGCQTAAPGLNYGNTFSLAKSFYRGGCRYVLASLWPVDDKVTMLFMNEFYHQLSQKKNIEKAYKKAIHYIAKHVQDPAYWGAFILIGN